MADNDKYFIDQMIEFENKRMEQQMKLERERLQAEIAAREATLQFQRDMMQTMMQMNRHPLQAPPQQQHFYDFWLCFLFISNCFNHNFKKLDCVSGLLNSNFYC